MAIDLNHTQRTDLRLELFDGAGQLVGVSSGPSNRHEISLANFPAGTYFARVVAEAPGVTSPLYWLSVNAPQQLAADLLETLNGPDNNTPQRAVNLGSPGGLVTLGIDPAAVVGDTAPAGDALSIHQLPGGFADVDYFRFEVTSTGGPADFVQIDFDHDEGDLDLFLETYNPVLGFSSVVAASNGFGDTEALSLAGLPPGVYYASVRGAYGATNPNYRFSLGLGAGALPIDAYDRGIRNDSRNTATDLGPLSGARTLPQRLSIDNASDEDWYRVELTGSGSARDGVLVAFDADAGDIDVELYRGDSVSPIDASRSLSSQEFVSFDDLAAGEYFVRVFGYQGATNGQYELTLLGPGADRYDDAGGNNSAAAATNLGRLTGGYDETLLSIDSGDQDWFRFETTAAAGSGQAITVAHDRQEGALRLQLYNDTGTQMLAEGVGLTGVESIDLTRLDFGTGPHTALPAGTYLVRIVGESTLQTEVSSYTLAIDAPAENGRDRFDRNGSANNSRASAVNLADTAVAGEGADGLVVIANRRDPLTLHAGDEDWYRINLSGDEGVDHFATIAFDHTQGDLDFELYYENESTPRRRSTGVANSHTLDLSGLGDAGAYYLRVVGFVGAKNASYNLLVSDPRPAEVDWLDAVARNDSRTSATDLDTNDGLITPTNLSLEAGDEDWFRVEFAQPPVNGHSVSIAFDHFLGDLQLELYAGGQAQPVRASTTVQDLESLPLNELSAGVYFVRVFGRDAATTSPSYSLVIDGPEGSGGDRGEQGAGNNTAAGAFDLRAVEGLRSFDPFSIHESGDDDWFRFELLADAAAGNGVSIAFDSAVGDLDLLLYDATDTTLLGSSQTAQDVEAIRFEDLASPLTAGEYRLLVRGHEGATNPRYVLSLDAPGDRLLPDVFEENDSSQEGTNLGTVEGLLTLPGLSIDEPGDVDFFTFATTGAGNEGHSVELLFDHEQGDLELEVTTPLLAGQDFTSQTDGNRERVSLDGVSGTIFNVIVRGVGGATSPDYTLVLDTPIPVEPDFVEGRTIFDPTVGQEIYDLRRIDGTLSIGGLSIDSPGDRDHYIFRLEADPAPGDTIRVDTSRHDGPLTLRLRSGNNTLLAEVTQTTEDFIEVPLVGESYTVGAFANHRIEVLAAEPGGTNPEYTLTISGRPPLLEDRYEGNDSVATAYELGTLETASQPTTRISPAIRDFLVGFNQTLAPAAQDQRFVNGLTGLGNAPNPAFSNVVGQVQDGLVGLIGRTYGTRPSPFAPGTELQTLLAGQGATFNPFLPNQPIFPQSPSPFAGGFPNPFLGQAGLAPRRTSFSPFQQPLGFNPTPRPQQTFASPDASNALNRLFTNTGFGGGFGSFPTQPSFSPFSGNSTFGFGLPFNNSLGANLNGFLNPGKAFGRSASTLTPLVVASVGLGDRDVYQFTLDSDSSPDDFLSVVTDANRGALRMQLLADDPATGVAVVVGSSDGGSPIERVSLAGLAAGDYYLVVEGQTPGVTNPDYALFASVAGGDTSLGDLAEFNNNRQSAFDLRTIEDDRVIAGLSIHESGDDDWFRFEIPVGAVATATPNVEIDFDHRLGDLDLELYAAGGSAPLAASRGNGDREEVSLAGAGGGLMPAGEYFVRVFGFDGATSPEYSLAISGVRTDILPDFTEPNNTPDSAMVLEDFGPQNHLGGLTLTTGDADYFRFTVPDGVTLTDAHSVVFEFENPTYRSLIYDLAGRTAGEHTLGVSLPAGSPETRYTLHHTLPRTADQAVNDWTVFVYMTASDLAEFAFEDVNELEEAAAALPSGVSLVVLWDQSQIGTQYATGGGAQAAWGTTGRAVIRPDTNPDVIATPFEILPEQNTGDPETALVDFVTWGAGVAPAENYGLGMWNHGQGVEGFNFDNADNAPADAATASELAAALATLDAQGVQFDLLAFDSCNMAMLELTDAFGDYAEVIVASQENIAGSGFTYDTMFTPLLGAEAGAADLAAGIVESFEARYAGDSLGADTLSAVTASPSVRQSLAAFASSALSNASTALFDVLRDARDAAASFIDHPEFRDLGQFASFVSTAPGVPAAVAGAAVALRNAIDQSVVAKTSDARDTSGVSIYLPAHGQTLRPEYTAEFSSFLASTSWLNFLQEFTGGATQRPSSLEADWAESNDHFARAHNLRTLRGEGNRFAGLSLHTRSDRDWFRFDTAATGVSGDAVTVQRDRAAGAWTLELYDANRQRVSGRTSSADSLTISLARLPKGEYWARVAGPSELTPRYTLAVDAPSGAAAGDWAGANRSPKKAFELGVVARRSVFSGLAADGVGDWFSFQTPRNQQPNAAAVGVIVIRSITGEPLSATLGSAGGAATAYGPDTTLRLFYDSQTALRYELSVAAAGGATDYVLEFEPSPTGNPLPGDYDGSGEVTASDYAVWKASFGQAGVGLAADGNQDGKVDAADFTVWRDNLGASATVISALQQPSPATGSSAASGLSSPASDPSTTHRVESILVTHTKRVAESSAPASSRFDAAIAPSLIAPVSLVPVNLVPADLVSGDRSVDAKIVYAKSPATNDLLLLEQSHDVALTEVSVPIRGLAGTAERDSEEPVNEATDSFFDTLGRASDDLLTELL
ncbi:MAG: clostripain-related cysteine peptidase [Planctomycetota bacterium]